jgi:Dolichyl-phosphate-mannose-protein mannosyltransferase
MVLVLFLAAVLRLSGIGASHQSLLFDEAYYAVDAHSLIDQPRLTPFFSGNFGRESGWMYVQVPFQLMFGATPLAPHLAVAYVGILTVAVVYTLCRQFLSEDASFWAAAALSVLYWHVNLSYVAFRALLYPLVGAIMFGLLLKALSHNQWRHWMLAAIGLGLLSYTYFAARLWIGLALGVLILSAAQRLYRRQAISALIIAGLIAAPLILYMVLSPEANNRISGSAQLAPNQVFANSLAWLKGFVLHGNGDQDFMHNIPGRSVFDPFLAVAWGVGLIVSVIAFWDKRRPVFQARWQALWLWALGLLSISASVLSDEAPDTLRAIGFVVFIAAICGVGLDQIGKLGRIRAHIPAWVLPSSIIALAAIITAHDFFGNWLSSPIRYYSMHRYINQAADFVKANDPENLSVYFSPEPMQFDNKVDSVIRYRAIDLRPRHIGTVSTNTCMAIPDRQALYAAHTSQEPEFEQNMQRWVTLTAQKTFVYVADASTTYTQTIYRVMPNIAALQPIERPVIRLGEGGLNELELRLLDIPSEMVGGMQQRLYLSLRPTQPLTNDYRVGIYLYPGNAMTTSLTNSDPLFDDWYCKDYPGTDWQTDEVIVRSVSLTMPVITTPTTYTLAVRIYEGIPFRYVRELRVVSPTGLSQHAGLPTQPIHVDPE